MIAIGRGRRPVTSQFRWITWTITGKNVREGDLGQYVWGRWEIFDLLNDVEMAY